MSKARERETETKTETEIERETETKRKRDRLHWLSRGSKNNYLHLICSIRCKNKECLWKSTKKVNSGAFDPPTQKQKRVWLFGPS